MGKHMGAPSVKGQHCPFIVYFCDDKYMGYNIELIYTNF